MVGHHGIYFEGMAFAGLSSYTTTRERSHLTGLIGGALFRSPRDPQAPIGDS